MAAATKRPMSFIGIWSIAPCTASSSSTGSVDQQLGKTCPASALEMPAQYRARERGQAKRQRPAIGVEAAAGARDPLRQIADIVRVERIAGPGLPAAWRGGRPSTGQPRCRHSEPPKPAMRESRLPRSGARSQAPLCRRGASKSPPRRRRRRRPPLVGGRGRGLASVDRPHSHGVAPWRAAWPRLGCGRRDRPSPPRPSAGGRRRR